MVAGLLMISGPVARDSTWLNSSAPASRFPPSLTAGRVMIPDSMPKGCSEMAASDIKVGQKATDDGGLTGSRSFGVEGAQGLSCWAGTSRLNIMGLPVT